MNSSVFSWNDLSAPVSQVVRQAQTNIGATNALWAKLVDSGGNFAVNLMVSILILLLTVWIAKWSARLTQQTLGRFHRRRGGDDPTLQIFAASVVRNVVFIIGGIAVLQQLGVKTTSIIAAVGAASLAIGLAMQGALSNVAAGVMILLFRPYRVGDIIESAGRTGRVRALDLFVTELATLDNLKVVIPNSKVFGDVVINHSYHDRRRADAVIRTPRTTDVAAMIDRLKSRLADDPRVFKDPPPLLETTGITEAFIEITVRPWAARDDYGPLKADILLCARMLEADPNAELPPLPPATHNPTTPDAERQPFSLRGLVPGRPSGHPDLRSPPKAV